MSKKRIIVLDDAPLIPTLIGEFLADDPDYMISKIATEKESFLRAINEETFDAALIDISVGGREGGLSMLEILKAKKIELASLVLSAHDEADYALRSLQLGAKGYLSKKYICTDLLNALKAVTTGEFYVSGDNGRSILNKFLAENPDKILIKK